MSTLHVLHKALAQEVMYIVYIYTVYKPLWSYACLCFAATMYMYSKEIFSKQLACISYMYLYLLHNFNLIVVLLYVW